MQPELQGALWKSRVGALQKANTVCGSIQRCVPRGTLCACLGGQGVYGGGPRFCLFLNKAAPELLSWVCLSPFFALLPKDSLNCWEN